VRESSYYTLDEVCQFLLGAAPLGKHWFDETPPGRSNFWWREHLRQAMRAGMGAGPLQVPDIVKVVADFYRIRPGVLSGHGRSKNIVGPRHIAMYLCRKHANASLPEIGDVFNRDHTTVAHALKQVESGRWTVPPKLEALLVQVLQEQTNDQGASMPALQR
jgi:hypothetical protein